MHTRVPMELRRHAATVGSKSRQSARSQASQDLPYRRSWLPPLVGVYGACRAMPCGLEEFRTCSLHRNKYDSSPNHPRFRQRLLRLHELRLSRNRFSVIMPRTRLKDQSLHAGPPPLQSQGDFPSNKARSQWRRKSVPQMTVPSLPPHRS